VQLAPELDDIDIDLVHEMVNVGRYSLTDLSRQVDRTPRHVRWAIMAWPLPSPASRDPINWETRIGPVLTTRDMTWRAVTPAPIDRQAAKRNEVPLQLQPIEPWVEFEQDVTA
jgi:hypothetical protein